MTDMGTTQAKDIAIFDRNAARLRRARRVAHFAEFDFLLARVVEEWKERLLDVNRDFPRVLDISAHGGHLKKALENDPRFKTRAPGKEIFVQADKAMPFIRKLPASEPALVCDEEFLPFAEQSFDLLVSSLTLQEASDLPGAFIQARRALRPDGLFLTAFFGGQTLQELRTVLLEAETETRGGVSPRIFPFTELKDLGMLFQRAGFALPVVDTDLVTVDYADIFALLRDLRGMGQSNVLSERSRQPLRRDTLMRAAEIYQERYAGEKGRIEASFEIFYGTGWAPHESQQKPLKPGSGKIPLGQALQSNSKSGN